jgi:uncharacterized protein (DUF2235 family)
MPKNIAVFADGTGNSAAKLNRTNVWRLYQALDTTTSPTPPRPLQLAYYHDGVGTSSFRPLAFLGGAFGWGLKRNLLDMYSFICRNYMPDDRIYLFGFSRGSFTVRVLAGFIAQEGLVQYSGDADLQYQARDAYRSYRRSFGQTGKLIGPLRNLMRNLRDRIISVWRRWTNCPTEVRIEHTNHKPRIAFIGVFDTVAAYGTPIAELTRGIDKWVWPLSMPDYMLSDKVDTARHALSLDDERDTFHPLLWDEFNSPNPGRILQVWFAGVHSDVGGGYPDDTLSFIPLEWMLDEAADANLVFGPTAVAEIRRIAGSLGPLHDSRRGLAGYYRYQPRKISARLNPPNPTTLLMQDPTQIGPGQRAQLASVNIHQSVFERIATGNDGYAPIVLNGAYTVIPRPGGRKTPAEIAPLQREQTQERVWDWVWHKRVNYFLSVGASLYLALLPVLNWMCAPAPCTGPQCLLAPIISTVGQFVPGFAAPWINAFAATPGRTVVAVLLLTWLLIRSGILKERIRTDMRALWEQSLGLPRVTAPPRPSASWIRGLRSARSYQVTLQKLKWKLAPNVFGPLLLGLIIFFLFWTPAVLALRSSIWWNEHSTDQCKKSVESDINKGYVKFETKMTCLSLQTRVMAGRRYRVEVAVEEPWADASISTDPQGFGPTGMSFAGNLAAPMRRSPTARWFQPLVKIVETERPASMFRIEPLEMHLADPKKGVYMSEFVAPIGGDAYFFVNDVLLPEWSDPLFKGMGHLSEWMSYLLGHVPGARPDALSHDFYINNSGKAAVRVEPAD